jgi:hypothetical protein
LVILHSRKSLVNRMGLDTVELLMGFEEAFGIAIPDEEAARMLTPRMVLDHVARRVPVVLADGCLTQHIFYALRRSIRTAGIHDVPLRPGTRIRGSRTARRGPPSGAACVRWRGSRHGRSRCRGAGSGRPGRIRSGNLLLNWPFTFPGRPARRGRVSGWNSLCATSCSMSPQFATSRWTTNSSAT